MAEEPKETRAQRVFEQPEDAITCYADVAQIMRTGPEIIIQFYESIPGPPSPPHGRITSVRSRLRATVIVSAQHATNIGRLLMKQIDGSVGGSQQSLPKAD